MDSIDGASTMCKVFNEKVKMALMHTFFDVHLKIILQKNKK